jgi:hypothetical protein
MRPHDDPAADTVIAATNTLTDPRTGLYMLAMMFLIIFALVALPAVWSAKSARRKAAASVLQQLLDFLRGVWP